MTLPNLFAWAAANEALFPARFEKACGEASAPRAAALRGFGDHVAREARVSVNMTTGKLQFFLRDERLLNPHEVARKLAPADPEAKLRELQGVWYEKRVVFDRHFERGEEFIYGAVNIGGDGLRDDYGRFCIVFTQDVTSTTWTTAYLPGNSLELYVGSPATGHRVDDAKVQDEAAPHAQRHRLAALKHEDQLEATPEAGWPAMLCAGKIFVEVIFLGEAKPAGVEEIRIARSEERRLYDMIPDYFRSKLDPVAEHEAASFAEILDALESHDMSDRVKGV